ncbi:MAG: NAD-dependent epimerase/dehydratase family protein [Candidatus Bipolaricaulota bacterium]|nr:NAD-dependent epimerase/dehydratase family protein [Candidatus Bipolaricaulota bacterium]MCS7274016.1 NAD-dependent epimerase/dehydratase family protein [Candidatus Bipolaricaulota bacterium]MDW8111369.1 NAD-dependent epimerase/dehydratase family protein [Candidatus Bipolaricaulota bacterium]MDW8329915.1 NAD-dependent epimerase/dehydratase family protein [Candidatus Bipolaricaulota bacterium]
MKTILVTGANGEIGHGLIWRLAEQSDVRIIALDIHELDPTLKPKVHRAVVGDILDTALLESLSATYNFDTIYHLAALLSTKAERQPVLAHKVNVDGTLNLLEMAVGQSRVQGREIKFLYPSSIAVYGLPDLSAKARAGRVKEHEWLTPRTMYGINKLYCEQLGIYYARYYRQLDADATRGHIDFRALRFPGLISAVTVPTGGTSDYAPEMLHAAAQGKPYACFVREDTRIPFMAMPDAIEALLKLEAAPRQQLSSFVYNVTAFNPSAEEIFQLVRRAFPNAQVTFAPDLKRQKIVDSWPADLDDSAARAEWGWRPAYGMDRAFSDYLVPGVLQRYRA